MKRLQFSLTLLLIGFKSYSQTEVSDSLIYSFINKTICVTDSLFINLEENSEKKFIYMDTSSFLNDTSLFTDDDFSFFRLQLQSLNKFKWENAHLNCAKIISNDTLSKIFKNFDGWEYFHAYYGECLSSFSLPLYSKDYSYCIIQIGNQCGKRRGKGRTVVYKIINNEWTLVKTYTVWKS